MGQEGGSHFFKPRRTTLTRTENHRTRLVSVLGGSGRGPSGVHLGVTQNHLFPTTDMEVLERLAIEAQNFTAAQVNVTALLGETQALLEPLRKG